MSYQGSKLFTDIASRFSIPLDHVKNLYKNFSNVNHLKLSLTLLLDN